MRAVLSGGLNVILYRLGCGFVEVEAPEDESTTGASESDGIEHSWQHYRTLVHIAKNTRQNHHQVVCVGL